MLQPPQSRDFNEWHVQQTNKRPLPRSFSKPAANECPMPRWACSVLMMVAYGAASSARASSSVRTTSRSSSNASACRSGVVSATVEFPRGPCVCRCQSGVQACARKNGTNPWFRHRQRSRIMAQARAAMRSLAATARVFAPLLFLPVWLSRSPGVLLPMGSPIGACRRSISEALRSKPEVSHDG